MAEEIKKKPGRKKLEDKKVVVTLYIHESKLNDHGGIEASKQKIYDMFYK